MTKITNINEINAAIALETGWTCSIEGTFSEKAEASMCWVRPGNSYWETEKLPNFCYDLNEMQKVFNWLCQNGDGSDADLLFWEGRRDNYGYFLNQCGEEIIKLKGGGSFYIHMNLVPYDKAMSFLQMINSENEIPKYDFCKKG